MKLLIIENEEAVRRTIRDIVTLFFPSIAWLEEADGVKSGIEKINSFRPDIVLLDVEMNDGTGFDLMKQIEHPAFQLIFITAHNQYAIHAFKFSAIDYLLKPVNAGELQAAINRADENIRNRQLTKQVEVLMQQLSGKKEQEQKIVLRDSENIYFIRTNDILYCMADSMYTNFFLQDNKKIIISKPLKEYEQLLEPLHFIRTHHSYLVNTEKIIRFDKKDGGMLILEGEVEVPLSQRKKEMVLSLLERK